MHDTLKTLKYRFESYIPANVLSCWKRGDLVAKAPYRDANKRCGFPSNAKNNLLEVDAVQLMKN